MKKIALCFIFLILTYISCFAVFADTEASGIVTTLPQNERAAKIEQFSQQIVLSDCSRATGIENFDISSNGDIAICDNLIFQTIDVFDSNGNFKYGYKCYFDGVCYVNYEDDELQIYPVRENVYITVRNGKVIDVQQVDNNQSLNSDEFFRHHIAAKSKVFGNTRYTMSWWIPNSSKYATLETCEGDGTPKTILDFRVRAFGATVLILLVLVVVFGVSALFCIKKIKKAYLEIDNYRR